MHSISISPHYTVTGAVLADGGELPADIAERLHALLAEKRLIGTVEHDPRRATQDDLLFSLVCDSDLRALRAGKTGKPIVGKLLENLEADLQRELGHTVSLTQDIDEEAEALEQFEAGTDEYEGESDDEHDFENTDFESGVEDLPPFDSMSVWDEEPPSRVLLFSKRGVSSAALIAWLAKAPVEAGVLGGWSAFRYLDANHAQIPDAETAELPSIELRFAGGDTSGRAYLAVTTPNARGFEAHTVYPALAAHRRAVVDASSLNDEAAKLLALTANAHLHHRSQANALAADPALAVDAEAVHAALAPEFEGATADRAEALLAALGVPAELARAAVQGDPLPDQQRFDNRRFWQTLLQIGEQGHSGIRPLGARPTLLGRFDDARRRRPLLDYGTAAVEAALGVALLAAGARGRGGRRTLGLLGGLFLLSDAVLDTVIAVRRTRRRKWGL